MNTTSNESILNQYLPKNPKRNARPRLLMSVFIQKMLLVRHRAESRMHGILMAAICIADT